MRRLLTGVGLLAGLVLATGCKDAAPPPFQATVTTKDGVAVGEPSPGRAKANEFLKALNEGKATPDDLTAAFKKTISRPTAEEADADVKNWLSKFEKLTVEDVSETSFGNATVLRGRAKTPGKVDALCLRVVREANGYKVDWLHRADRFLAGPMPKADDSELAAAADTARNFLETMLGGDLRQAQAIMDPKWLASIEAPSDADKKNGFAYNVGFVTQKMRAWRGETVGYAIPAAELTGNKDTATVTAELEAGGQKKTYLVKLVKDKATGQWLVDDFAKA